MRYQLGFVNLTAAAELEIPVNESVFTEIVHTWHQVVGDLTLADFRNPDAGWVVHGVAAPFVRILEVSNATPEEEEAAARRAANV